MLTYTDIQRLASEGEGKSIEFKETTGQLDRGMETLCAFLNGNGGTLLFGITDNGKIIGQDISDKTRRDIADALFKIRAYSRAVNIVCQDTTSQSIRNSY